MVAMVTAKSAMWNLLDTTTIKMIRQPAPTVSHRLNTSFTLFQRQRPFSQQPGELHFWNSQSGLLSLATSSHATSAGKMQIWLSFYLWHFISFRMLSAFTQYLTCAVHLRKCLRPPFRAEGVCALLLVSAALQNSEWPQPHGFYGPQVFRYIPKLGEK